MYISDEQLALEKIDADFKKVVDDANELAQSIRDSITDEQWLEYADELDQARTPDYHSKKLRVHDHVLSGGSPKNEIIFIPEGVEEIDQDAFNTKGLRIAKIIFPNGLKKINDNAFKGRDEICELCVKDPDLCYPAEALWNVGAGNEIDQFSKGFSEFPNTLEEIGENAFRSLGLNAYGVHKKSVEYIVLPKSLRKIGQSAFFSSGIKTVYFNGADTISVSCFQSCRYLTKVIMSGDVKRIDKMAFDGCDKLKDVVFSENLKEICDLAFAGCCSLEQIALPNGLEKIGKMAFVDCGKLAKVTIPESVTDIDTNAFCHCPNVVIRAQAGSYAEQYATEHHLPFQPFHRNRTGEPMDLIEKALTFVEDFFEQDFSGHDYFHTLRVFKMATHIATKEQADLRIVQLAALLHDVDDRKLSPHTCADKANARRFLANHHVDETTIQRICHVIGEISYAGKDSVTPDSLEGQCVQDADRLDAIGAIGIARAFAYGGSHNRFMHHPAIAPKAEMSKEEYHSSNSTTINHFYEKLFLLKDLMNTPTAKELAQARDRYMREYVAEFMSEWDGIV